MTTETTTGGTRLQLSLSGKGLKNVSGLFETSDPFAVVMSRGTHPKNPPILIGRTDVYVVEFTFVSSVLIVLYIPFFSSVG